MTDILPPPPLICPTGNACNIKLQEGPRCGTSQEYFPPEPLAEQICPWAIAGAIQQEKNQALETSSRRGKGRAIAGKEFRLGSLYTELAMAYPRAMAEKGPEDVDTEALLATKKAHLATAKTHLDEAASRFTQSTGVHAAFLGLYLPMFMFRNYEPISPDNVAYLQNGLLDIADNAREHQHRRDIEGRAGIHLLYARQRRLAFPASAREQAYTGSQEQFIHPRSHLAYTFDKSGERKIPHSLRSPRGRIDTMGLLFTRFGKTAEEAYNEVAPNTVENSGEASDAAFNLLYTEAAGETLRPQESRILSAMTRIIDRKRHDYLKRTEQNSL